VLISVVSDDIQLQKVIAYLHYDCANDCTPIIIQAICLVPEVGALISKIITDD